MVLRTVWNQNQSRIQHGLVRTLLFIASVGFLLLGLFFIAYGLTANGAFAALPLGIILMAAGAGIAWLINKTASDH